MPCLLQLLNVVKSAFDTVKSRPALTSIASSLIAFIANIATPSSAIQSAIDDGLLVAVERFCSKRNVPLGLLTDLANKVPVVFVRNLEKIVEHFTNGKNDYIRCDAGE